MKDEINTDVWFLKNTLDVRVYNPNIIQKIYLELSKTGCVIAQNYIQELAKSMEALETFHSIY